MPGQLTSLGFAALLLFLANSCSTFIVIIGMHTVCKGFWLGIICPSVAILSVAILVQSGKHGVEVGCFLLGLLLAFAFACRPPYSLCW